MTKRRVPLHQNPRGFVEVEDGATRGAQLGRDLLDENGRLLTRESLAGGSNTGGPNSIASTIWRLIREVPLNIQKLAALATSGFAVRRSDGEWATRTLQQGAGITISNPAGEAGDPVISLADVPDSGVGVLLATTFDAKGRKTGSRPATITGTAAQINVANGNASAGLPTLSLASEVLTSLGKANTAVQSVVAGIGITVNNTDPRNPVVSAPGSGFAPPPTDGSPYVGLNGAWEKTNAADSRFWLIEYPLLTDQVGNQLTDQAGNFLMGNSPIIPSGWPSTTTVINNVSSGSLQSMTLAQANALASPSDFQMVAITDLTGGREPCWYDATVASGTKWRRFSDRSIAN